MTLSDFNGSNVWSYTRVSTKDQFLHNGSIENQVKRIKSFASQHNLHITEEFDAEYESSKRINTQSTLRELINKIRKTNVHKRPKMILIWSPSRFGRSGAEHIQLFVSLRKEYNVYLYSVSTDHNTFNERAENEFSSQLLYAQRENFTRQDTIIPGLVNALQNGKTVGKSPRGYDHYGPRVSDPTKVQARQEIKINKEGELLKEAFKLKIYKAYSDTEIRNWLSLQGMKISKQTLSTTWRNIFYTGKIKNSLIEGELIKGSWEPIVSQKDFERLQQILSGSSQVGKIKINGKEETPLIPKFLICNDCNTHMTSYKNKVKNIFYYKCGSCNKTINANSTVKSLNIGLHDQFKEILNEFSFSKNLQKLISFQLEKLIELEIGSSTTKRKLLSEELNILKENYDKMEYRFAVNEISSEIFERQSKKLKEQIEARSKEFENLPSKKSNHKKALNFLFKISGNLSKFYDSLDYHQKRKFQYLLFPEGLEYSIKSRECRTSKISILFELTKSISKAYINEKQKTHQLLTNGSYLVAGTGLEPVTFGL